MEVPRTGTALYRVKGLYKVKGLYHDRATGLSAFWEVASGQMRLGALMSDKITFT